MAPLNNEHQKILGHSESSGARWKKEEDAEVIQKVLESEVFSGPTFNGLMEDRSGAACMSRLRLLFKKDMEEKDPARRILPEQVREKCFAKLGNEDSQAGKRKSQLELQEVPDELRQYTLPRNRIAHLQETTQIQQSELDGLRKEHGRLQGKIEGQENEIQGLKEKCTDLENESSGLKDQSSAYQSVGVDEQQDPRLSREGSPVTMADIQVRKDSTAEKKRMNDELAQAIEDEDEEIQRGLKLKRARTSGVSR